jgi:cycloeucalenol cycloisomerase
VAQVALDALAAGMLVTLLLDLWRITVGGIVDSPAAAAGLQWAVEVQG